MNIMLSADGCQKNNITIGEILLLLAIYNKVDFDKSLDSIISKGFITAERNELFQQDGWRITRKGNEIIDSVVIDSFKSEKSDEELLSLASKLKEIFPQGKKEGTSNYWAEGRALIAKRLKAFFKKYGNNYTDDQIIKATKKYIEGFNGNYKLMRTLKYFIFKDVDIAGEREYSSDLLTYLENAGQEDIYKDDWTSTTV